MSVASDLGRIQLFAELSSVARRRLAAITHPSHYEDGQIIILEGDAEDSVFFVLRGTVRVFRTSLDGREQTLIHLGSGEAFNMPAAFADDQRTPASAMAVGPVDLLSVGRQDFVRIVGETTEIALAVLRDFSDKLYHLTDLTYDLGLLSVRGRLARFLLTHGRLEGVGFPQNARGGPGVPQLPSGPIRWTHEEIAARIGTVREVVSRTLRAFVKDGLIRVERHRVIVLDRDALAREAQS